MKMLCLLCVLCCLFGADVVLQLALDATQGTAQLSSVCSVTSTRQYLPVHVCPCSVDAWLPCLLIPGPCPICGVQLVRCDWCDLWALTGAICGVRLVLRVCPPNMSSRPPRLAVITAGCLQINK